MSIMTQMGEESWQWQQRAEKAEADVRLLRAVLERIVRLPESCRGAHETANWAIDIARAALERKP